MIAQVVQLHLLLLATKLKKQQATYIFEYPGDHDVFLQGSAAAYLIIQQCNNATLYNNKVLLRVILP